MPVTRRGPLHFRLAAAATLATSAALIAGALVAIVATPSAAARAKGVLSIAEAPGAGPNYIFPFLGCQYFAVANVNQFQQDMYRPLYWFGLGDSAAVVDRRQKGAEAPDGLSLAARPVYSDGDKTVTIRMGSYVFASGQHVDPRSVMFFLNLYRSDPSAYCGYNRGYGIPDQVASARATRTSVVITFTTRVNPAWITYNYLSEITPLPDTWDVTAPGTPSTCATGAYGATSTDLACRAVLSYLDRMAKSISTYPGTFWQSGVDGPYRLTSIDSLGNVTFVPNRTYAGPQKSQVAEVKLVAFTSAPAEMNALRAGTIDVGYADTTYLASPARAPGEVGPNWSALAGNFTITVGSDWGMDYAEYNFSPKNPEARFLDQLYIRRALQDAVDEVGIIDKIDMGYGQVSDSPLPAGAAPSMGTPPPYMYPYSLRRAATLLSGHGWKEVDGSLLCERPGTGRSQCGKSITRGDPLAIHFEFGSGEPSLTDTVQVMLSAWRSLGIKVTPVTVPLINAINDCAAHPSGWSVCDWGAGWIYAPEYYPSGEWGFVPGASFNFGDYNNPTMTAIVKSTTFGTATLTGYARYFEEQLPVLFQPNSLDPGEISDKVGNIVGLAPNPLQNINPEYYYFKS